MTDAVAAAFRHPMTEQQAGRGRIRELNGYDDGRSAELAAAITRQASSQTYFTIHYLVDRALVDDAYRAYAYFRWVDDTLDQDQLTLGGRLAFLARQREIISGCYQGQRHFDTFDTIDKRSGGGNSGGPAGLCAEEQMVVDLIHNDQLANSGLRIYINEMMAVMAIDVERRGRFISQAELDEYTRCLATAVTEAMHYFIGHNQSSPQDGTRYLAVTGAHITHMLRDMIEDTGTGYYNIPQEFLEENGINPDDVHDAAIRAWVIGRVQQARECFAAGRRYMAQVENLRCRLAGYAYIARFEVVLDAIEKDGCWLRAGYPERRSKQAVMKMALTALAQTLASILDGETGSMENFSHSKEAI